MNTIELVASLILINGCFFFVFVAWITEGQWIETLQDKTCRIILAIIVIILLICTMIIR